MMEMAKNAAAAAGSMGAIMALLLLCLWAPPVTAGRPGCFDPFLSADPFNLRHGAFKLSSFGDNGLLDSPPRLLEVRFSHLHRQGLLNSTLSHSLLGFRHSQISAVGNGFVRVWRLIPSDDPRLVAVIRSRRSLWRPDVAVPRTEEKSLAVDSDISLVGLAIAFTSGFALAFLFYWIMVALRAAVQKYFMCAMEDHEMGFLYGYQALPSLESFEKNISQEESPKENPGKMENV